MMIRLFLASLWRRPRQLLLILVAVAVTAATVTALASFTTRARSGLARDLALFGPNLVVRPEVGGPSRLPQEAAREVRSLPGVQDVARVTRASARVRLRQSEAGLTAELDPHAPPIPLLAVDETWAALHPTWEWTGRHPRHGEAVRGAQLRISEPATAMRSTGGVPVVGTLTTGAATEDGALILPQQDLADWNPENPVDHLEARVAPARLGAVAQAIQNRIPGVEAQPLRRISDSDAQLTHRVALLLAAVAIVTLLLAGLSVATSTTALIGERRRELALFLALGYSGERVGALVGAELLVAALVAALLGALAGEASATTLSRHILGVATGFGVTWQGLTAAALAALVVVGLSSVLALRRIRQLDLAFLLRGD